LIRSGLADPSSAVRAKAIWEIGDSVFGYIPVTNAKMGLIEINRNLSVCFQHFGQPRDGNCDGCESLYVIHLYTKIAQKKAHSSTGIIGQLSTRREEQGAGYEAASADTEENG
jgi:hypothetical protein